MADIASHLRGHHDFRPPGAFCQGCYFLGRRVWYPMGRQRVGTVRFHGRRDQSPRNGSILQCAAQYHDDHFRDLSTNEPGP